MAQRTQSKQIIVFGGSFNPPHIGHAAIVKKAAEHVPCNEVWFIPSADRKDKKISISGEDRFRMVSLMVKDWFDQSKVPIKILRYELDRNKQTTTFETKAELEKLHPDCKFHFLIGSDIVPEIKTKWVRGEEVWNTTNFIVCYRKGFEQRLATSDLPPHSIFIEDTSELIDMSSTFIRNHIQDSTKSSEFLSPSVVSYILEKNLYSDNENRNSR